MTAVVIRISREAERLRLVHELDMVETKEEADELDRKISALTALLDEDDARYAPGAEQARTRRRLEIKLEESKIETIEIKEEPNSEEDEAIFGIVGRRRGRSPFGSSTDPNTPRDIQKYRQSRRRQEKRSIALRSVAT